MAHQKAIEALQLRARGLTYDQIAKRLGYKARSTTKRAIEALIRAEIAENAEAIHTERAVMLERLDMLTAHAMMIVTGGVKVIDQATGEIGIVDPRLQLTAVDTVIRLDARRSSLLGTDGPIKHEVSGTVANATVAKMTDAELAKALEEAHG